MPSWFYNGQAGKCETFIYGGCGGNSNRFQTELACRQNCGKTTCILHQQCFNFKSLIKVVVPELCIPHQIFEPIARKNSLSTRHVTDTGTRVGQVAKQRPEKSNCFFSFLSCVYFLVVAVIFLSIILLLHPCLVSHIFFGFTVAICHNLIIIKKLICVLQTSVLCHLQPDYAKHICGAFITTARQEDVRDLYMEDVEGIEIGLQLEVNVGGPVVSYCSLILLNLYLVNIN